MLMAVIVPMRLPPFPSLTERNAGRAGLIRIAVSRLSSSAADSGCSRPLRDGEVESGRISVAHWTASEFDCEREDQISARIVLEMDCLRSSAWRST